MSAVISTSSPAVDLAAVKIRQQAAWSTGNYAVVSTTLQIVGENLCEALDLRGQRRNVLILHSPEELMQHQADRLASVYVGSHWTRARCDRVW